MSILDWLRTLVDLVRYNFKVIFAGKFIYFLLFAFGFFAFIGIISLFDSNFFPGLDDAYALFIFPGMLLILYPTAFSIQNDADNRTLEMLFGIPDYRFKVWLVRMLMIYLMVYAALVAIGVFSAIIYIPVDVFAMAAQVAYPVFFFGSLSFMFATIIRNGNGTAAVMAIIALLILISSEALEDTRWSVFLNPFDPPNELSQPLWEEVLFYNRLYLFSGSAIAVLMGLLRLQQREKFIS